jgi:hypothetical protein
MSKRNKLTKAEAVQKLTKTRSLSTDLLEPLGLPFESWLRFAQAPEEVRTTVVNDLIAFYNADDKGKQVILRQAADQIEARTKKERR